MTLNVGDAAPAFDLPTDQGSVSLAGLKGRKVVLYFYPKDDTPGCTKEACGFRDRAKTISKKAVVLGVSKDSIESHSSFIAKFKLPFTLLSDPDAAVMKKYGAWGEKLMYGKPVTGTIRSTVLIGPDGIVLKQWSPVRQAEAHPEEVLDFLNRIP